MSLNKYPVVCIIPSLNPDNSFLKILNDLFHIGITDIVVVDDGSRDECKIFFAEAKKIGATVLTHEVNRGKGAALKTAFNYYFHNYDADYYKGVVTADADGQHLATDIKKAADALIDSEKDMYMVLGTRNFNDEIVPFKSRNGNKITTFVFELLFGRRINDTQTGLRGISNSFLKRCVNLRQNRFEYEINMLIDAVKNDVIIEEVPISTVYIDGNRETHFRPFADSFKIYSVMFNAFLRYACSGIVSWILDQVLFLVLVTFIFRSMNNEIAIILATIIARIVSSLANYFINSRFVFEGKNNNSFFRYYTLCICQMLISATCVALVHYVSNVNSSLIKIVIDALIFFVNYRIQQKWVFNNTWGNN